MYWTYKLSIDTINEPAWYGWDSWDVVALWQKTGSIHVSKTQQKTRLERSKRYLFALRFNLAFLLLLSNIH